MDSGTQTIEHRTVMATPDGRVTRKGAAEFLGYSPKTLSNWALDGKGPRSLKVGGRVFYTLDALRAFVGGEA